MNALLAPPFNVCHQTIHFICHLLHLQI
jgi:hypothetical protein